MYTAYQPLTDPAVRAKFEAAWGTTLPEKPGLTTTEFVDGVFTGRVKGWYLMGENPLMSEPHQAHAREAVEQLEFLVSQDIFFNETNIYADVILPAASFAEQEGTFTNTDRRVQRVAVAVPPPGEARPDWQILTDLAHVTLEKMGRPEAAASWSYASASDVWEEMRRLTPEFWGINYERLAREHGVHWPCPTPDHPGTPYLFEQEFPRGRGKFWPVAWKTDSELPDDEYPFVLSTGRVLYHWHGGTMTRVSSLDAIWPECTVELHPKDAQRLDIASGDWVEVSSRRGSITARALVTGRSPRGLVFVPFHFAEAAANVLTDTRLDARAKIPDYKVCAVRLARAEPPQGRPGADVPLIGRGAIKDPVGG